MDQIKIGKFIASCRKEQGMTQAVLAEMLGISDRAISKWETGKSMPDSGIMLDLCELLKINVNELLSGERIMAEAYDKRAEENLLAMRREVEEKNRQMLQTEYLDMRFRPSSPDSSWCLWLHLRGVACLAANCHAYRVCSHDDF
jgi:transcriptional regulator with XRE-family HTH domain